MLDEIGEFIPIDPKENSLKKKPLWELMNISVSEVSELKINVTCSNPL